MICSLSRAVTYNNKYGKYNLVSCWCVKDERYGDDRIRFGRQSDRNIRRVSSRNKYLRTMLTVLIFSLSFLIHVHAFVCCSRFLLQAYINTVSVKRVAFGKKTKNISCILQTKILPTWGNSFKIWIPYSTINKVFLPMSTLCSRKWMLRKMETLVWSPTLCTRFLFIHIQYIY
jgi:hypothetical protein